MKYIVARGSESAGRAGKIKIALRYLEDRRAIARDWYAF
jgi:hypothetical protein